MDNSDVEAEAAIFHGSGSCKREMNGSRSGSSKKILEAEFGLQQVEAEAEAAS